MDILFHSETKIALFYLFLFAFIRFHLLYHSLSFVITHCINRCHSLSFVVTRCYLLYHSLSLFVILCITHWNPLSFVIPLVVTRCTTCLSFYKQKREYGRERYKNLLGDEKQRLAEYWKSYYEMRKNNFKVAQ